MPLPSARLRSNSERAISRRSARTKCLWLLRPRDLAGLRDTLAALPALRAGVAAFDPPLLRAAAVDLAIDPVWHSLLSRSIHAEPAAQLRDGGVIADGYDAQLDELRAIDTNC